MRAFLILAVVLLSACAGQRGASGRDPMGRVTAGLRSELTVRGRPAPETFSLARRMAHYKVPGVSIAVVEGGRIAWARGFGVREAGTADSVTSTTLFQAASISKPVAATGMLRMVDEGKLALDTPVNEYLVSWKLPENQFTAREKVTLRRLASHSAGLTVHGFAGYAAGERVPTAPEILDGNGPSNSQPVRVNAVPGSMWRYSGGGTTIEQLVMADVAKEPFPALMRRLVLEPAGMANSTFEQPLPAALRGAAASGHGEEGEMIPGRWHVYPEMAAAGLWTTPSDLLTWAMEIAAARGGRSARILSRPTATAMLTPQKGASGLGPTLGGRGDGFFFSHGGSNAGFRAQLIYFPETGQGAAVMTNGAGGDRLAREILLAISAAYGWPGYGEIRPLAMSPAALDGHAGSYSITEPYPITLTLVREEGRLFKQAAPLLGAREEVVFTAPGLARGVHSGIEYTFHPDRIELLGLALKKQ
ncbi:MAG: Beta-lactamase class C-like and penicillin binding proteins (PBPs) superfamily [uncultured Gemmatimonadetes bacterium]|uniref:Beta-lactamase class C-like and penicillin binding proteins (PBPs) superfamily n=1 Tax=uncultured Gemmatimonadota bacterium TaxID=203437 RepID=A0A6J4KU10_9BACT|nr:MAG: Beta-lactamase class C-like and penicillin binding proteins (PBPs) superfamily [uncultured Gemmatimonadota bacterium]